MGIFDKLRNEFIDIIDWAEQDAETLVWKFPRYQNEIKMNAKLTVREAQQAVFINEGKIADVFTPGMYTLQTQNMPILATLKGWKYGFDSPFKADVLFVSTRQAINQKWGTKNAITVSDDRFGMIELRAFGTYAFRVTDAGKFIKEIAGIEQEYTTDEIGGQLKSIIATRFTAAAANDIPIEKFASNLESLSAIILEKLNADFDNYGLKITNFMVENVSMPEELKKEIFEYSRLNKIDMQQLAQLKSAKSIEIAAANEGIAGMGAGLGAGIGVGNMMANSLGQSFTAVTQPLAGAMPPPLPTPVQYFTGVDGKQSGPYDANQIVQMIQAGTIRRDTMVWKTGMAAWAPAESISDIGLHFNNVPPPLM